MYIYLYIFIYIYIYIFIYIYIYIYVHCCCSIAKSCPTLWDAMDCSSRSLLKLMSLESVMPSIILSSPSSPALNLSQHQGLFQWVDSLHWWPKYWSFSFSINPSSEHPGLISFRMDWLDLLAAKGLTRVFSNTAVQKHQFFCAQLSSQSNSHIHTWPLEKP